MSIGSLSGSRRYRGPSSFASRLSFSFPTSVRTWPALALATRERLAAANLAAVALEFLPLLPFFAVPPDPVPARGPDPRPDAAPPDLPFPPDVRAPLLPPLPGRPESRQLALCLAGSYPTLVPAYRPLLCGLHSASRRRTARVNAPSAATRP